MWWIFQEAEQLFSILPPPPQIMLNSGRLRLALQRGKHLLLSRLLPFPRGRFFHQVQSKRVIQEGNDSEIKELPIKRDLTPNSNWHSEGNRFTWGISAHLPWELLPMPQSVKCKLHKRALLALTGNYSPKWLRDIWAPLWCFLRPINPLANSDGGNAHRLHPPSPYSGLQEHQDSPLAAPEQEMP